MYHGAFRRPSSGFRLVLTVVDNHCYSDIGNKIYLKLATLVWFGLQLYSSGLSLELLKKHAVCDRSQDTGTGNGVELDSCFQRGAWSFVA
jgi:hypothetical protein